MLIYWVVKAQSLYDCSECPNRNTVTTRTCVFASTVYPKKYAHGFVVLCFVVVMQSFIMNSHEVFIHIHQGCLAGTGAIARLPQCQWSEPDGYGKISQCITTTKHSKAKPVCIFLGIYCNSDPWAVNFWLLENALIFIYQKIMLTETEQTMPTLGLFVFVIFQYFVNRWCERMFHMPKYHKFHIVMILDRFL